MLSLACELQNQSLDLCHHNGFLCEYHSHFSTKSIGSDAGTSGKLDTERGVHLSKLLEKDLSRILLLAALAIIAFTISKRISRLHPQERRAAWIKLMLAGLILAAVILTLMGKLHWIGAAVAALLVLLRQALPLVLRAFPILQTIIRMRQASAGQQSTVETTILSVRVDMSSGVINGKILAGGFAGQQLSELNEEQLQSLLEYCQKEDLDSARLLISYLERNHQKRWQHGNQYSEATTNGSMDHREALAALGLEEGADKKEVITAHRRLMQKIHPDRGGSDYLAAKINQAKDLLMTAYR